jgi:hypothetical protein
LLVRRDTAPFLGLLFRPQARRNLWQGNPAQTQGEVVQPFQEIDDGHFAAFEYGKEIIGGCPAQRLIPFAPMGLSIWLCVWASLR